MCAKVRSRFTLVEILVVLAVIAVLMGAVVGIADFVSRKNGEARTRAVVEMLRSGLEQYKAKYGYYPPTLKIRYNGYTPFCLDKNTANGVSDNFNQFVDYNQLIQLGRSKLGADGRYQVLDGFGVPIYYRCPGYINTSTYDLGSLGIDGKLGDASSTAVTSADAKDHFGKGDDITNCPR